MEKSTYQAYFLPDKIMVASSRQVASDSLVHLEHAYFTCQIMDIGYEFSILSFKNAAVKQHENDNGHTW